MMHPRSSITSILPLLLLALAAAPSRANMAAPLKPGSALGEPRASLAGLRVERERLEIDLRPLALEPVIDGSAKYAFGRALISATYVVANDSLSRPVGLEFVAEALDTAQWSVTVDGRTVAARYRPAGASQAGWPLPPTTPGLDGRPLRYDAAATGLLRFDLVLDRGLHTIRVEYVAEATRQVVDHPLVHWQLGYLLAPAKHWPSFGTLDVSIVAPPGWIVATEPALDRSGDELTGRFAGIPADALTITTRAPYAAWYPIAAWLPAALAILLGSIAAYRLGRTLGRRLARNGRRAVWAVPAAIGAAFVMAVGVGAAGLASDAIEEALVGAGQDAWGGYGFLFGVLLLAAVTFVAGFVLVQTAAARAIGRARRRYDARWIDAYPETGPQSATLHDTLDREPG